MAGLFGQTLGDFGGRVKGLLSDPQAQTDLLQNPMFNVGMGILSNPGQGFAGAMQGLGAAREQQMTEEDRKRMQDLRDQLAALIAKQGGGPGAVPGQPPPTPTEQAAQMSLNPGQPGSSLNVPGEPTMGGGGMQSPLGLPPGSETSRLLQMLGMRGFQGS